MVTYGKCKCGLTPDDVDICQQVAIFDNAPRVAVTFALGRLVL